MATLVLTVVGGAIGGPLGAAIGAVIGRRVDGELLAPPARHGPRLKELDVQTSSYGFQIPAIFGQMRVAGTVIWASDLIERRVKSGGGKGRPATVDYSYSVNMAVALSSKPILGVDRIWADGNLIRGSAGNFSVETDFRLHHGYGDQPVDPLMASAEGGGACPAYRDLAYAVFEELQLADFGNRIPSLTFEVIERDGDVTIVDIARAASDGLISGESAEAVRGYALSGDSARTALAPLIDIVPAFLRVDGDQMRLNDHPPMAGQPLLAGQSGANALDRPAQRQAASTPRSLALRHYEPERDYQAGVQRAERSAGRTEQQVELAAAIGASEARRWADLALLRSSRAATRITASIATSGKHIGAGDVVELDGRKWLVDEAEFGRGITKLSAHAFIEAGNLSPSASPGRVTGGHDFDIGTTKLLAIDLPAPSLTDPARPLVGVAAAGTGKNWRRAALSLVQGDARIDIGRTARPATMGVLVHGLPTHSPLFIDEDDVLSISCLHDAMPMPAGVGDPLSPNAPLVWVGGEHIRYGTAEYAGDGVYHLRRLLRGCFGTVPVNLVAGGEWLLVEQDTLSILEHPAIIAGADVAVEGLGVADSEPATASCSNIGLAIRPLSPVHLRAEWDGDGNLDLSWARRSRLDASWQDGVDQMLADGPERYIVDIIDTALLREIFESSAPTLHVTATQLAGLSRPLIIEVRQVGRFATSEPVQIAVQ